jgi:hypothetical protein
LGFERGDLFGAVATFSHELLVELGEPGLLGLDEDAVLVVDEAVWRQAIRRRSVARDDVVLFGHAPDCSAGLSAGTTYHYRLVASSEGGISYGEDETFTTPGIVDPLINPVTTPLIATLAIAFPTGSQANTGTTTKTLTSAQKLAAALKACHAKKGKKRAACEVTARKRYAPVKRKGKKK